MLEDVLELLHYFVMLTVAYMIVDQVIVRLGLVELVLGPVGDNSETLGEPYEVIFSITILEALILCLLYELIDFNGFSVCLLGNSGHYLLTTDIPEKLFPNSAYLSVHT